MIDALGGTSQVAVALGIGPSAVSQWRRAGTIPAPRWQAIATLARTLGVPGISLEALAALATPPAGLAA